MNQAEALLCAVIAQAAYINRYDEEDFYITAKFENKGTDTQGFFGVAYDNTFVVAFRGSEETGTADWITDLKIFQEVFPYARGDNAIKVHYGFSQAYKSVRETVIRIVKEQTDYDRIICVGHSLGGGLAKLCALDISYNAPGKKISCYTYGSPKVGNAAFARAYNERIPDTYRIVNGSDIVPSVPLGDYAHVGQLCPVGGACEDDSNWEWSDILTRVVGRLEEHFPHNYIKQLRGLM